MQLKLSVLALSTIMCTSVAVANQSVLTTANPNPQSTLDYWTPERMAEATPMDTPIVTDTKKIPIEEMMNKYKNQKPDVVYGAPPTAKIKPDTRQVFKPKTLHAKPMDFGTKNEYFSSQQLAPLAADQSYPYTAVGKLFFTTPSGNKTCTGVVIANRLVATAAHCMYGLGGAGWYKNWMFVPAYRDGTTPFLSWAFMNGSVSGLWTTSTSTVPPNAADYGVLSFKDQTIAGTVYKLADLVGKLGYQTQSLIPNHAHLLAYSGNLDSGNRMHQVTAQSAVAVAPNNAEYGSDMSSGIGGGPFIQNFGPAAAGQTGGLSPARNMVIGISSYCYNDTTSYGNGSSILNSDFTSVYNNVCAQSAGNC